jgi:hypothetical protein
MLALLVVAEVVMWIACTRCQTSALLVALFHIQSRLAALLCRQPVLAIPVATVHLVLAQRLSPRMAVGLATVIGLQLAAAAVVAL